jgi:hypothetical protein
MGSASQSPNQDSPELRAFDALGRNARLSDLVAVARALINAAAEARREDWGSPERVTALANELNLGHDAATTPFGDALAVLERGPEDDAERALACALAAHVVAEAPPKGREAEDRAASDLLWLAAHTPFDATGLLDRALGDAAGELWDAIADRIRRIDQGKLPTLGRGEALVGGVALAQSASKAAAKHAAALAAEVRDRKLAHVLVGRSVQGEADRIDGEIAPSPRNPALTVVLAMTGILFLMHAVRLLARLALAYKRPAQVSLSDDGVRIRFRTELLGRTLRDRDVVIQKSALLRATREVRYPRAAFYAGLLALALGTYFGVGWLVEGARAASPSLLLTGLLAVVLGIGLELGLGSIAPGARGRCRVLFVQRHGPQLCIGGVDVRRADAALARLAPR